MDPTICIPSSAESGVDTAPWGAASGRRESPSTGEVVALATLPTVPDQVAWPVVVDAYLDADIDNESTRRAYRRHLVDALTGLLGDDGSLEQLTGAALARYRAAVTGADLAPATQAQRLAAIRSFLRWSGAMGAHRLSTDAVRAALRTPRASVQRPYAVLTEPEVRRILEVAPTVRDTAILAVLLGAGLRASEVCALDVDHILEDHEGGAALYVRMGKGRKDRVVPIQPDVTAVLRTYLRETGRRLGDPGPLFRAHDRAARSRAPQRMAARSIGYLVERVCAVAGIDAKRISPHSMRHTFAIRALRASGNVVSVSKLLGHSSVTTTQRYTDHLDAAELRAAVPLLPASRPRRR